MTETVRPAAIAPDTKDWTWVLEDPCGECGYDAAAHRPEDVPALLRGNAAFWRDVLAHPDAAVRPEPATWSATEYACHVRDVHRVFDERLRRMLSEDAPLFANWDQDATAVEERYDEQRPAAVAAELAEAAERVATTYAGVGGADADAWRRTGFRDNGSAFTVATLALYHLHDVVHHRWDVRALAR